MTKPINISRKAWYWTAGISAFLVLTLYVTWAVLPQIAIIMIKKDSTRDAGYKLLHILGPRACEVAADIWVEGTDFSGHQLRQWRDTMKTMLETAEKNNSARQFFISSFGGNVDAHFPYSCTPLSYCACYGHVKLAAALIDAGADVNAKDISGWTPLHYASYNGRTDIVQLLINNGADANAKRKDGWTPLHYAAAKRCSNIIQLLIDNGADVNAKRKDGWTPLHYAASEEYSDTVQLLIDKGADVNALSTDGETPLDLAIAEDYPNIVTLLRAHGAKTGDELLAAQKSTEQPGE